MLYTRIATLNVQPGKVNEYLAICEKDLLPRYRDLPGFVGYTVAKTSDATAIAFSLWETRTLAEQAVTKSEQWMKDELGKVVISAHQQQAELPFFAFTGELKPYTSVAPVGSRQI
jgi:hypothetical protein